MTESGSGAPRAGSSGPRLLADEGDTARVAAGLAASLDPGDVVHLSGPLGAGKTTFVRHACAALGVTEPVTSPTFAIAHAYRAAGGRTVSHLDLYRSRGLTVDELADLDPYLTEDAIVFVEWPASGGSLVPPATVVVTLTLDADGRTVAVERRA